MGNHMTDQRFEDWWSRNPARVALSPAAKEVARGVWQAARDDLVAELKVRLFAPRYLRPVPQAESGNKGTPC